MIKRIGNACIIIALITACNSAGTKKEDAEKNQSAATGEATTSGADLIKLDTAVNAYNILCQDWVLQEDAEGLEGMEEDSKFEVPYRSFYLSATGTFVKNPRNNFDYGNWSYDEASKTLVLNNSSSKTKDVYRIINIRPSELTVTAGNDSKPIKFIAPGKRFKDPADEPYALDNNRWRIKPAAKEPDSAIHQRLKENLRFFILFYKSALAKGDTIISFWGLPSCFKWYGGAIFIKKKQELKPNWINCFYNEAQAMQAYALADRLLSQKYDWPKGERNWIKLNLAVVELMYKKLDEVQ